jgi:hypothetical protein
LLFTIVNCSYLPLFENPPNGFIGINSFRKEQREVVLPILQIVEEAVNNPNEGLSMRRQLLLDTTQPRSSPEIGARGSSEGGAAIS